MLLAIVAHFIVPLPFSRRWDFCAISMFHVKQWKVTWRLSPCPHRRFFLVAKSQKCFMSEYFIPGALRSPLDPSRCTSSNLMCYLVPEGFPVTSRRLRPWPLRNPLRRRSAQPHLFSLHVHSLIGVHCEGVQRAESSTRNRKALCILSASIFFFLRDTFTIFCPNSYTFGLKCPNSHTCKLLCAGVHICNHVLLCLFQRAFRSPSGLLRGAQLRT